LQQDGALRIGDDLLLDAIAFLTLVSRYAGTPAASVVTSCVASRFSSEKKPAPSVTRKPRSRVQAMSTRG
jgi:hypothetical protein